MTPITRELAIKTYQDVWRREMQPRMDQLCQTKTKRDEVILEAGTFAASCFDKESKRDAMRD